MSQTQKVIIFKEIGGLDVLKYEDHPIPTVGKDSILIKNKYAGVNFIEAYFRKGIYPCQLPYIPGREASGVVVAVGDDVKEYAVGDKVAYLSPHSFAQFTAIDKNERILKLPIDTSDEQLCQIAGSLLQGLTALTFVHEAYAVQKGDYVLVYAAAGGVGLLLTQLLHAKGAHTIAVASTEQKLQLAKKHGAEFLVDSSRENVKERVLQITSNLGVHAIFDSIGKDTFETDLKVIRRKGTVISFGNASGVVPAVPLARLTEKNIKLLRPQVHGYIATKEEWKHYTEELFRLIKLGELKINITKTFPLEEYREATKQLESRSTVGKLVLTIPQ